MNRIEAFANTLTADDFPFKFAATNGDEPTSDEIRAFEADMKTRFVDGVDIGYDEEPIVKRRIMGLTEYEMDKDGNIKCLRIPDALIAVTVNCFANDNKKDFAVVSMEDLKKGHERTVNVMCMFNPDGTKSLSVAVTLDA